MKIVIIVSCLLATAAAISTEARDKLMEEWKEPIMKCSKENGFSGMTLQEVYEAEEKAGVDNSTCLHACLLRSLGALDFFGIDALKMGKHFESVFADRPREVSKLTQAAMYCAAKVNYIEDECKMAYLYSQCFLQSD